ncbi:ThuA domain-containing protein [bacterium]|nr:ThuA domain-containing protein [bacterium]
MKKTFLLLALAVALVAPPLHAAEDKAKIKVLVVTGGHGFDRPAFFKMYQDNAEIEFVEAKQGKSSMAYDREDLLTFDVVVTYDLVQTMTDAQRKNFLALFDKGIGLVVNHHALATYQDWPAFEAIVGGKFLLRPEKKGETTVPKSGVGHGELTVHVEAKDHPIAKGVDADYPVKAEFYNKCRVSKDVTLVLTTDSPRNNREICWTREQGKSRVVYLMSGHDAKVYTNPNHLRVLANAIRFAARRDDG